MGHQRLETTTIYTKVAQIRGQIVKSPIDQWKQSAKLSAAPEPDTTPTLPNRDQEKRHCCPSVGTLKIHFKPNADTGKVQVTLEIMRDNFKSALSQRVFLTGILVQRNQQNWIQLTMPDINQWQQSMLQLSDEMVKRIHSPEFYETLRAQICQRFLALF